MMADNIKVVCKDGEYKDFPYKYEVYLYGKCVWTDDFNERMTDNKVIKEFAKELNYLAEEL